MTHDEIVDLLRSEHCIDDACGALCIFPKFRELIRRQFHHIHNVLSEDHEAVSGVVLVPSKSYVARIGRGDEGAVFVCQEVCVCAHPALLGRRQAFPLVVRPPRGSHRKRRRSQPVNAPPRIGLEMCHRLRPEAS